MKICFVGLGSIAKRHIKNIHEIYNDKSEELRIDVLRRKRVELGDFSYMIDNIYTSVDDLKNDYDVLFITNPTEYHAETLKMLHEYAKNFFIEKPISSLDTIGVLKEIEYKEEAVYHVACPLRYTAIVEYLKNNINKQEINSIRCISSSYLPDWRPGVDYRKTYSANRELGGGVSQDLIHEWDYITYLFGIPNQVQMLTGKVSNLEITSEDYALYIARYNSFVAEIHLDYFGRQPIRKIELYMENDTIICDFIESKISYLKQKKEIIFQEERNTFQMKELKAFISDIEQQKWYNDVDNSVNILKLTQGLIN